MNAESLLSWMFEIEVKRDFIKPGHNIIICNVRPHLMGLLSDL